MGLKDLNFKKEVIQTSGGDLAVRGLSLPDIVHLATTHVDAVRAIFDKAQASFGDPESSVDYVEVLRPLAAEFPGLIADVITLATGEFESEAAKAVVAEMPFPDQLMILEAIGKTTFATDDALKKAMATVLSMIAGTRKALPELAAAL